MATTVSNSVPLLTGQNNNNGTLTDEFISGLAQGGSWTFGGGARVISYSLDANFDGPSAEWTTGWVAAVDKAFTAWESVANVTFADIDTEELQNASTADISLALAPGGGQGILAALGIFPDPAFADELLGLAGYSREGGDFPYPRPEGDITFDNLNGVFANGLLPGRAGFHVILHEIGHALGLKHTDDDGGNGRPTFASLGIGAYGDPGHTLMHSGPPAGAVHLSTPGPLDVLAIQHIYGANMTTATGNTVYLFDLDKPFFKCIWDAGGTDAISVANFTRGCTINLNAGSFSSINIDTSPPGSNNLSIAYGVTIEQAFGGAGADKLFGNGVGNAMVGNAGSDVLAGGAGNDTLVGGAGNDIIRGDVGTDKIRGDAGADTITYGATDSIDGGYGNLDTLKIASGNLDLTTIINTRIINIEKINMTAGGANTLTLNTLDVLALSSSVNTVTILGDAADTVDLVGDFTLESTVGTFETWVDGSALVRIEVEINVI